MPRIYDTPRTFKSSLHFQNSLYFSSPHKHNNLLKHESSKTRLEIALHERKKVEKSGEKRRDPRAWPNWNDSDGGEGKRGSLIKRLGDMPDGPRRTRLSGDPPAYK